MSTDEEEMVPGSFAVIHENKSCSTVIDLSRYSKVKRYGNTIVFPGEDADSFRFEDEEDAATYFLAICEFYQTGVMPPLLCEFEDEDEEEEEESASEEEEAPKKVHVFTKEEMKKAVDSIVSAYRTQGLLRLEGTSEELAPHPRMYAPGPGRKRLDFICPDSKFAVVIDGFSNKRIVTGVWDGEKFRKQLTPEEEAKVQQLGLTLSEDLLRRKKQEKGSGTVLGAPKP